MKRFLTCLVALALMLASVSAFAYEELPEIQFPLDTDVTLKIWMPISSSCTNRISSYAENESFIYAQEATGIKVDFIHPSNSALSEDFNMMIVSGDLPDIIVNGPYHTSSANATSCVNGVEDGIYLDLTDYMPQYSPTYWNYINTNEEFYQDATTPEGRVYYYTNYKNVTAEVEGSYDRFQVRKDWLDEVGLETLRTVDDYEKYFQNILDNHPGVTPFTLVNTGIERCFTTAFYAFDDWFQIDGVVKYGPYEDGMKDYLALMAEWYKKGYISPDFTSYSSEREAYLAGESGGYCGTSVDTFELAQEIGLPIQNCPYMRVTEDQFIHGFYYLRPANGQFSVVTAESEHIAEAMMFIDYGYQVEGSYTYCYGVPGKACVYGDDGLPKYTDYILNNPDYNMTELSYILRFHEGFPHMRDSDAYSIPSNSQNPACLAYRLNWMDEPNWSTSDWCLPRSLSLPNEDSIRRSEIMTDIDTYRSEMVLKYITGQESVEETFDAYQQHFRDLGIEEAIELTQKAYDILMAKKLPD
ncbi:MAG: extracellular solute-binding protein [Clostridia bacterium]|nr:extracellular solute-binding protein [Clostridia bacterium]